MIGTIKEASLSGAGMSLQRCEVKWPFAFVVGSRGESVGWAVVNAPIVSPERQTQLADLRNAGFRFLGMSSDVTFPRLAKPDPLDYSCLCEAWCHCFRHPNRYLPTGSPRALLSASDFTDYRQIAPGAVREAAAVPYFVYVGATVPWKRDAKNWDLARRCVPRLCREAGLRALLVGTPDDLPASPSVTLTPHLPWRQFLAHLCRARFLFVPNEQDASPRVLAEALCLDVPIVVNRRILGGWKYINAFTGLFFDGEEDVVAAVAACLARPRRPRNWFRTHHGPFLAGQRLLALLRAIDPSIDERSHLGLTQRIDGPLSSAP